ncbi:TPA: hypothetical protein DDW35_12255 [Candidatus Sumerlaeota bacterium]|nr:hypothetical protein [Candidatus Sumerlaeota bacterium]
MVGWEYFAIQSAGFQQSKFDGTTLVPSDAGEAASSDLSVNRLDFKRLAGARIAVCLPFPDVISTMSNELIKILIVDDDPVVLSVLEETFSNEEHLAISTMSDSEEAYLRLEKEPFDLLITDLMMPHVDGLCLLGHATKCQPDILVVMVSGYASLETTLQAIHAGVYDYITKPFRVEEFRLLVHNVAAHIRLKAENKSLAAEITALKERVVHLENSLLHSQQESGRLEEELGRWQEMVGQTGVTAGAVTEASGGGGRSSRLSYYEKGVETADERFDREFHNLESLFSEGRLTPEEFDMARQRLKTLV